MDSPKIIRGAKRVALGELPPRDFRRKSCPTKEFRAVSSAVERLVYTERVGGSKPSPPIPNQRSEVISHRGAVAVATWRPRPAFGVANFTHEKRLFWSKTKSRHAAKRDRSVICDAHRAPLQQTAPAATRFTGSRFERTGKHLSQVTSSATPAQPAK